MLRMLNPNLPSLAGRWLSYIVVLGVGTEALLRVRADVTVLLAAIILMLAGSLPVGLPTMDLLTDLRERSLLNSRWVDRKEHNAYLTLLFCAVSGAIMMTTCVAVVVKAM